MGFFDRFRNQAPAADDADAQAIARYRYLLRTAPPEAIEQAHAEAFAQLTPEQRRRLLAELAADMPDVERNAALRGGDQPGALAQAATRAELRQPGSMERAWNRMSAAPAPGMGMGLGGMFAGSFLASMAGSVLGTVMAQQFFGSHEAPSHLFDGSASNVSGGDLADDPWQRLDSSDVGDSGDFGGGMDDGGSFDV